METKCYFYTIIFSLGKLDLNLNSSEKKAEKLNFDKCTLRDILRYKKSSGF